MKSPSSPFMLQEPYRPRWCACHVEPVLEKKLLCAGYWADSSCFFSWWPGAPPNTGWRPEDSILEGLSISMETTLTVFICLKTKRPETQTYMLTWTSSQKKQRSTRLPQMEELGSCPITPLFPLSPFLFFIQESDIIAHYQEKSCFLLTYVF